MQRQEVVDVEDIVVVGAGLAGLATALGLHRKGVRSLVLESSPALRTAGFAFTAWKNAFRALDALAVGNKVREQHLQAQGLCVMSSSTGEVAQELDLTMQGNRSGPNEIRCVRRDLLLQALEEELPRGTIRYSSKIVSVEEDGSVSILHLADGSTLRAKVLIGCDGINSVVAKWLGLAEPSYSGRMAARGLAHFPDGHGLEPKFLQFIGRGFRSGMRPCNHTDVYWFFTWTPSEDDKGVINSWHETEAVRAGQAQGPRGTSKGDGSDREERGERGLRRATAVPAAALAYNREHQQGQRLRGRRRAAPDDAGPGSGRLRSAGGQRRLGKVPRQCHSRRGREGRRGEPED